MKWRKCLRGCLTGSSLDAIDGGLDSEYCEYELRMDGVGELEREVAWMSTDSSDGGCSGAGTSR